MSLKTIIKEDGAVSLFEELHKARNEYAEAKEEEALARSRATAALNRLNDVQKKIDVFIETLQKDSRSETNWGLRRKTK